MKKILLATTMLVGTAGFAAAEGVTVSGSARAGIVYDSTLGTSGETYFSSRTRVVFTGSGETDGGLSFGFSVRADQQGGNNNDSGDVWDDANGNGLVDPGEILTTDKDGDSNGDSTVFISGAFGKLTFGDVSGAADALVGQVSGVGYGPNDSLQEIGFVGTDKTAVYYEYSAGDFTVGVGVGQTWDADDNVTLNDTANIGVKYSTDAYSVALAYETSTAEDLVSASASATFGAATVKARVSDSDIVGKDTTWALSVDYAMGATTITGFYTDFGNTGASVDTQHIGLGASYDLGGGATLAGGIVRQNNDGIDDETFADVGVKFSF